MGLHLQPIETAELEQLRTDTASFDDFHTKQETESVGAFAEQSLIIDHFPASYAPRSIETARAGAPAAAASALSAASASAHAGSAAVTAENYLGSPIAPPSGASAGKTLQGKLKLSTFGASAAAIAAMLLLLFTAPYVTTSVRHQTAEVRATATEEATGTAVSAATAAAGSTAIATPAAQQAIRSRPSETPETLVSPSAVERLDAEEGANLEALAADAATEAVPPTAAASWSLEAIEADARWLAQRLKTRKGNAALEKIVTVISSVHSNAHEKPIPSEGGQQANLQGEREQQQQHQHDEEDRDMFGGALKAGLEGSASQDLHDGIEALIMETGAALASEIAALKQEKLSLTKAQIALQVLMEDAASVIYGTRERALTDYVAAAQAASDAIVKDELKLHALGRRLQLEVRDQRAAATGKAGLLLKQAIVAVKAAKAIQARSRRVLEDGLQWCKLGEQATVLCAQEKFFLKKMNLASIQLTSQLEMSDSKTASGAALLAAREDASTFTARMHEALSLTQKAEAILKTTSDSFRALDAVQTASSLVSLLRSKQENAPNSSFFYEEEAEVGAAGSEMEGQQQGVTAAAASTALTADARKQVQKREGLETERHETEDSWEVIASLINDVQVAATESLVFHLDKPVQREGPKLLLAILPSQEHYEKWRLAHANARHALVQMQEAAARLSPEVTGETMNVAISRFYDLVDTFKRHAREAAMRFYLCKAWEQAENSLSGVVDDYKLALNTLATLRGGDKATSMKDALSWKLIAEDAAYWGVLDLLPLIDVISEHTLEAKDEIAKLQAGFKPTEGGLPERHNKMLLQQQESRGQQEQLHGS
ncbi:hypothetical protein Emag_003977 [Eimeria magna]